MTPDFQATKGRLEINTVELMLAEAKLWAVFDTCIAGGSSRSGNRYGGINAGRSEALGSITTLAVQYGGTYAAGLRQEAQTI